MPPLSPLLGLATLSRMDRTQSVGFTYRPPGGVAVVGAAL
jgi:hypothetical protein